MFPWVSLGLNEYDTQPWFFIFSLPAFAVGALNPCGRERIIYIFCFLVVFFLLGYDFYKNPIDTVRSIVLYMSLCQAVFIYNRFYEASQGVRLKFFLVVNLIWLLYSIFQYLGLDVYFPLVLSRTSDSRGLTSLAPEPTFYAVFSILEIFALLLERRIAFSNVKYLNIIDILLVLNIVEIFFIAKSSMGIALCVVVSGWFFAMRKPMAAFLLALAIMFFPFSYVGDLLSNSELNTRPMQILSGLIDEPSLLLLTDQSINQRLGSIYISLAICVEDFFMPHGVLSFFEKSQYYYYNLDWFTDPFDNNKILSYYGSIMYEVGFISIMYFYYVWCSIKKNNSYRDTFVICGGLTIVLLTAVPLGLPLVGMVLAAASVNWKNYLLDSNR